MRLDCELVRARLASPFRASHGSVELRELVLVTLETDDGLRGRGEAAPLHSYDGVTLDQVQAALDACRPVLSGADGQPHATVLARCAEVMTVAPALAAVDLALWDLAGKRAGLPVWRLLADAEPDADPGPDANADPDPDANPDAAPDPIKVNWTLGAADRAGAAAEAARACEAGFTTLKAKVAIGDDSGRLAAVRAVAGSDRAIRIDANGAWSVAEAEAALSRLEPIGIELCEEPVTGLAEIKALSSRTSIPLALDETARIPPALDERACELICLKIASCGGLTGLLSAARRARTAGYEVFLASSLEGPLGIAAALHGAAAIVPSRACGLATLAMFTGRPDPLPASQGVIEVPRGPGLGEGLLDWYRVS